MKRPNITPRKQEIQDMVTVLEAPHEDAQAAAKAAIKQAYNILFDREWWTIAERGPDGTAVLLGAWPTLNAAMKGAAGLTGGQIAVFKIAPPAARYDLLAESDEDTSSVLCSCGHPAETHSFPNNGPKCVVRKCRCRAYEPTPET